MTVFGNIKDLNLVQGFFVKDEFCLLPYFDEVDKPAFYIKEDRLSAMNKKDEIRVSFISDVKERWVI